ncbi:MAG TPA: hypothetical protein VLW85_08320 [Myxococcales bacterium]|nr:hypothetical protein [Myxococcales bacterium]
MKLTLATVAAVLVCMFSLIARSYAMKLSANAHFQKAYAAEEKLALEAIDGHLRANLKKLSAR